METIGKGVVVVMLLLKSLSPSVGNRVSTAGSYIPDPNRTPIIRVAVIPFDNVSSDSTATDKMMDAVITYLLHTQVVDVAEPILLEQQLLNQKVRKSSEITLKAAAELKKNLGVNALLLGKITAYQIDNSGGDSIPVISVNARLLDVDTLGIIWSTTIVRKGNDRSILFDVGRIETLSDLNLLVANDLSSGLGKEVQPALDGFRKRHAAAVPPAAAGSQGEPSSGHPAAPGENTGAGQGPAATTAQSPAVPATAAAPAKPFIDLMPEIAEFEKGPLHERKQPLPQAEGTYYKGGIPIFVKITDCAAQEACDALRTAMGPQQPGPSVNGDESTQSVSKMGLVTLSVVKGRYLLQVSGGEASLEDMRTAGKAILTVMER